MKVQIKLIKDKVWFLAIKVDKLYFTEFTTTRAHYIINVDFFWVLIHLNHNFIFPNIIYKKQIFFTFDLYSRIFVIFDLNNGIFVTFDLNNGITVTFNLNNGIIVTFDLNNRMIVTFYLNNGMIVTFDLNNEKIVPLHPQEYSLLATSKLHGNHQK